MHISHGPYLHLILLLSSSAKRLDPVAASSGRFINVIACDDVREELGNKHSLMGVFGGDILAVSFPANVQLAFYIQYAATSDTTEVRFDFRIMMDDTELIGGKAGGPTINDIPVTVVLPKGVVTTDKDCKIRLLAKVNGGKEVEILNKKIRQA